MPHPLTYNYVYQEQKGIHVTMLFLPDCIIKDYRGINGVQRLHNVIFQSNNGTIIAMWRKKNMLIEQTHYILP